VIVRFRTYLLFFLVSANSVAIAACSSDTPAPSSSSSGSSGTTSAAKFGDDVMPILTNSCAFTACHGSTGSNRGILLTVDKAQVYAELQKESPTYKGVKFVVAGKPDQSFVVAKIEGTQAKFPGCSGGCGLRMPQQDDESLEGLPKEDIAIIKKWITNGAKND
jgi:hypothetical protein